MYSLQKKRSMQDAERVGALHEHHACTTLHVRAYIGEFQQTEVIQIRMVHGTSVHACMPVNYLTVMHACMRLHVQRIEFQLNLFIITRGARGRPRVQQSVGLFVCLFVMCESTHLHAMALRLQHGQPSHNKLLVLKVADFDVKASLSNKS